MKHIIETRYPEGYRKNGKDLSGQNTKFTGERMGIMFYKGRAEVEDEAVAQRLVVDFHYYDATAEVELAKAGESPASFAPKLKGALPE